MTREEALAILDTIPTISEQVDALEMAIEALQERKTGKWKRDEYGILHCSNCNTYVTDAEFDNHTMRFCFWCGARLEIDE